VVPLDRSCVVEPDGWWERVERSLADPVKFWRKARAFEKLALSGRKRRAGFVAYAGEVLKDGAFPGVWRHEALKAALEKMTRGHCAYCQACVEDNSFGPVEHVQPKSLFPLLAFTVDNYLFGCQRCNLAKSDKWPESGSYVRPDVGDPRGRFVFDEKGWMHAALPGDRDAEATIEHLGLNRKGLRRQRRKAIRRQLEELQIVLRMPGLTEAQRIILARLRIARPLTRFSEAINQNVRRAWQALAPSVPLE
jgi:uncharacterized protein (TIGR02646 family)